MKKSVYRIIAAILSFFIVLNMSITAFAHSGRTDSSGGHNDNKNKSGLGGYHYHCGGYPAHLHTSGYCPYTDVFPSYVKISTEKSTLRINESVPVSAAVYPSNSCSTYVSWESSDTSVVKIQNGMLVAVGYGTATVTATSFNDKIGKIQITVKEIVAEELTIENQVEQLYIGETQELSCTITPEDVDNPEITWTSSDESIATVSKTGKLTAINSGIVQITATTSNDISAIFDLTVEEKVVESIEIQEDDMLLYLRDSVQLNAIISPADATYKDVVWASSEESVLSISEDGVITALTCGEVTVTATSANELVDTIQIVVDEIIAEKIQITGDESLKIGSTMRMGVEYFPENTTIQDIEWESSDETILTISDDGILHAHNVGVASITAIQKDVQTTMEIEVLPIEVEVVEIRADIPEKIYSGDTVSFSATVLPTNATYPEVTWSTNHSQIASIDKNGMLTAHLCGKVTVTASTVDGIIDTYVITVYLPNAVIGLLACGGSGLIGYVAYCIRRKRHSKQSNVYFTL